jgi:hypothetical protein
MASGAGAPQMGAELRNALQDDALHKARRRCSAVFAHSRARATSAAAT